MTYLIGAIELGVFVAASLAIIKFEPQIGTIGVMAAMLAVVVATGLALRRRAR
jgi:hypothetical protein